SKGQSARISPNPVGAGPVGGGAVMVVGGGGGGGAGAQAASTTPSRASMPIEAARSREFVRCMRELRPIGRKNLSRRRVGSRADLVYREVTPHSSGEDTMNVDDLILVSIDDHVVEPPDMFDRHAPAKYRDRVPHVVKSDDGLR